MVSLSPPFPKLFQCVLWVKSNPFSGPSCKGVLARQVREHREANWKEAEMKLGARPPYPRLQWSWVVHSSLKGWQKEQIRWEPCLFIEGGRSPKMLLKSLFSGLFNFCSEKALLFQLGVIRQSWASWAWQLSTVVCFTLSSLYMKPLS